MPSINPNNICGCVINGADVCTDPDHIMQDLSMYLNELSQGIRDDTAGEPLYVYGYDQNTYPNPPIDWPYNLIDHAIEVFSTPNNGGFDTDSPRTPSTDISEAPSDQPLAPTSTAESTIAVLGDHSQAPTPSPAPSPAPAQLEGASSSASSPGPVIACGASPPNIPAAKLALQRYGASHLGEHVPDEYTIPLLEKKLLPSSPRGRGARNGAEGYFCHFPGCSETRLITRLDHAKAHVASHVGSKPHKCKRCSRGFLRPFDLKRHGNTCHVRRAEVREPRVIIDMFSTTACGRRFENGCRSQNLLRFFCVYRWRESSSHNSESESKAQKGGNCHQLREMVDGVATINITVTSNILSSYSLKALGSSHACPISFWYDSRKGEGSVDLVGPQISGWLRVMMAPCSWVLRTNRASLHWSWRGAPGFRRQFVLAISWTLCKLFTLDIYARDRKSVV